MNQIDKALTDFCMLERDGRIVVGLSGGADSVTLTHYLKTKLNLDVIACHINHNLRGEESIRDMNFVKQFCEEYGIPLFVKDVDVKRYSQKNSLTVEEAGREIRYDFFEEIRVSQNAEYIATAHTLSDNAETVLLNLTRGTGLNGLCGIPAVRGNIIRPLIYCTRDDIESYCNVNKLSYVIDSTNKDSSYSRNNIRNNVIPILKQINPSFEMMVLRSTKLLNSDRDCLLKISSKIKEKSKLNDGYNIETIACEDTAIRNRVIAMILDENDISKSADLISHVDELIISSGGKINAALNKYIEVKSGILKIYSEEKPLDYFEDKLILGEYTLKSGDKYKVSRLDIKTINLTKKVYKNLLYIMMDYDKIKGIAVVRQRKPSDKIEFVNRNGTRSLKKLFIDEKLSLYEKSKTPVICDDQGVIAVFPYGVSKSVSIDEETKNVLLIEKIL